MLALWLIPNIHQPGSEGPGRERLHPAIPPWVLKLSLKLRQRPDDTRMGAVQASQQVQWYWVLVDALPAGPRPVVVRMSLT
jgi:hypothetical protein